MNFYTERLEIRKLAINDKQALIKEIGNWEVAKYLANVPFPYSDDDAEN